MAVATRELGHAPLDHGPARLRVVRPGRNPRPHSVGVYVRRRLVVAALLAAVVAGLWTAGQVVGSRAGTVPSAPPAAVPAAEVSPAAVVVRNGDTLWDLVGPLAPSGASRHAWIARIVEVNGVDPLRLQPGTVIRLPATR